MYQFTPQATTGTMSFYLMFGWERTKLLELSRETIGVMREEVAVEVGLNMLKGKAYSCILHDAHRGSMPTCKSIQIGGTLLQY